MDGTSNSPQQSAKRPRPVVSCLSCRQKKLKCDRRQPCEKCVKGGRSSTCTYTPGQTPLAAGRDTADGNKRQRSDAAAFNSSREGTSDKFDDLQARVRQLERVLEAQDARSTPASQAHSDISGSPYVLSLAALPSDQPLGGSAATLSRTSVVNQFEAVQSFVDELDKPLIADELGEVASDLHQLHNLIRRQQKRAQHTFHLYDNIQDVLAHMEKLLPPSDVCTILIQLYFTYLENCIRVLHRATDWTQFRAYLDKSLVNSRRDACVPLLLSVVSSASSLGILPECENPELHGQSNGIGAYQLLRNYLDLLSAKQWSEQTTIQLAVMTLKYHKSSPLTALESWQWSGQVVRRAMAVGLHESGLSRKDVYGSEVKRKLWLTILELDLTFAIASNMPANCPAWQGAPPSNVDDAELWPGLMDGLQGSGPEEWTDGICQHVLAQSFNDRLAAYNLVSLGTIAPYSTILVHTRRLEQVIHDLPRLFRLVSTADDSSDTPHRLLAKMELDFLLRRPLNACYAPYAAEMPLDDKYQEARILWVQGTSFSICFQDLFDPKYPSLDLPQPEGLWDFFYNVYSWDVHAYFLASCLELQRLRLIQGGDPDVVSPAFQRHTLRSSVKVMGWNIEGIMKSLEDTIDPMARRVGRHGSSLRQVVRWTAVIGSLRINPTGSRHHAIKSELQSLVYFLKAHDLGRNRQWTGTMAPLAEVRRGRAEAKWLQHYLQEGDDGGLEDETRTTDS